MKRRWIEAVMGLALGLGLMGWVLRGFEWRELTAALANWEWLVFATFALLGAHALRAWRWLAVLRTSGAKLPFAASWWALMLGYLANLLLPRFGEILRCSLLWRWHQTPLPLTLGSVVAERLLDVLILLFLVGITAAVEGRGWLEALGLTAWLPLISLLMGIGLLGIGLLWRFWLRRKARGIVQQALQGFMALAETRPRSLILLLSLGIWVGYWLSTMSILFADAASERFSPGLVLWASWILLTGSALAMALPVPGGLGTFHAIGLVLLTYLGWEKNIAQRLVVTAHAFQTLLVLLIGAGGLGYAFWRTTRT
ncbi:MAG: lysylphosphatidylglycerol synthase transmembrane domain-containing protein [Bacteroidia bacterium]